MIITNGQYKTIEFYQNRTITCCRCGKIVKNVLRVFERGENLLYNVLHFVIKLSQSSEKALLELSRRKTDFSERGLAPKGFN